MERRIPLAFLIQRYRSRCVALLERWRPLFFGHNDVWVDGDRLEDPYAAFTEILLEEDPVFWGAYERRDYDTVFATPGFPDRILEAVEFWKRDFAPLIRGSEKAKLKGLLTVVMQSVQRD